ncbi:MAG: hypothetical protein ACLFQ8_01100 [Candidatus Aenigmatarchaeota archaeon]
MGSSMPDENSEYFPEKSLPFRYENDAPVMSGRHPADRLIDSERVADNTFENEEGERVIDLGDGFYNIDKGYARRYMGRDEFEELSRFMDLPDGRGRPRFELEDGELYVKKGSERKNIDDPDVDFRYAFPEMRDIAGGTTLPPEEQGEEETSLKKKLLTVGVAGALVSAGVAGVAFHDTDDDGLRNYQEWSEGTDWRDPDTSGDGIQDGTAVDLGLDPTEQHPSVAAAYPHLGEDALQFQGLDVCRENLTAVSEYLAGLDDASRQDAMDYLSENPEHIPSLTAEDGNVSELAFQYMEDFEPEVLEAMNSYTLSNASEELAEKLMDLDVSEQIKYAEAVDHDGDISDLAVNYLEDFDIDTLTYLSNLMMSNKNETFAEGLMELPEDVGYDLASEYTPDKRLTWKEVNQTEFLDWLEDRDKLNDFLDQYEATNYNVDGDGFTNWFEVDKSDFLEYDTKNRVFAAHINALEGSKEVRGRHFNQLMDAADLPEDRIWELYNESATWSNFENLTDYIAENMTEHDKLLLSMRAHGTSGGVFGFYGGGQRYDTIADEIEPIPGLKAVFVDSCYGGAGKDEFTDLNNTVTLFSADANNTADAARFPMNIWHYMRTSREELALQDQRIGGGWRFMHSPDLNEDGEVSLGEAFETYMETHIPPYNMTPEDYREALYENVSDPEARRYPQLVDPDRMIDGFYIAQALAVDRSDNVRHVVHPM